MRKQKDEDRAKRNALKLENETARLAARTSRSDDNTGEVSAAVASAAKPNSPPWELEESKNILKLFKRSTAQHLGGVGPRQKRKQMEKRATKQSNKAVSAGAAGPVASGSSPGWTKGSATTGEKKSNDEGKGTASTRSRDVSDSGSHSGRSGKSGSIARSSSEGSARARKRLTHKTKTGARYASPNGLTVTTWHSEFIEFEPE